MFWVLQDKGSRDRSRIGISRVATGIISGGALGRSEDPLSGQNEGSAVVGRECWSDDGSVWRGESRVNFLGTTFGVVIRRPIFAIRLLKNPFFF